MSKIIKVGLVGIGFMGRGHLDQYMRLEEEGFPVKLTAICDVDEKKFEGIFVPGNLDVGKGKYDFSKYSLYTCMDEMLAEEELDYVDIALPTYLHSEYAVKALNAGRHVISEKPMALNPDQCQKMIDAAKAANKNLMVAQCLRFWPAYETLKHYVESGELGKPVAFYFYRGGSTPEWSFEDWLRDEARSGGCLLDQHVHDVDMVNWLFGPPKAVSSLGRNVLPGSGIDAVSTNYLYDGFVANAQDDWSMNGDGVPFSMLYRANFEGGAVIFERGETNVYPLNGKKFKADDQNREDGYYREIKYFINSIINGTPIQTASPESTRVTICIATAERESVKNNGAWIPVKL